MPSIRKCDENHGSASTFLINLDEDCDFENFEAGLQNGFDELRLSLLRSHRAALDCLRSENDELRAELKRNRSDYSRPSTPGVLTTPDAEHVVTFKEQPDESRSSWIKHDESKRTFHSTRSEIAVSEALQRLPLIHYHLKKVWVNLVETAWVQCGSLMEEVKLEQIEESFRYQSTETLRDRHLKYSSALACSCCPWFSRLMMYPHSPKRLTWGLLSLLLLGYDFIMIPFNVSFDVEDNGFDEMMQMASCIFWTCDIFMTLFTGFYSNFRLIMDPAKVFLNYVESWFSFDISLVTLDWLVLFLQNLGEASIFSMFRGIRVIRIMRMLRFVRIARLGRFRTLVNEFFVVTPDILYSFLRFSKVFLVIVTFAHIGACCWAMIGKRTGGWIHVSDLHGDPVQYQYAVALHWMVSALQGSRPTLVKAHSHLELYIDSIAMLLGFVLAAFFIATITQAVFTSAESDTSRIHRMARRYLKAHDCSAETRIKTLRFLQSHNLDGPAELIAYEAQLFRAFPKHLQEDLHYESRASKLCRTSNFAILHQLSSRCVRQLCNEMYEKLAGEGELVFTKGDACNHLYMVRDGLFKYKCEEEVLKFTPRQLYFPRSARSMTGCDVLTKGQFLCEATFWTDWENVGELGAMDHFGILLMFDADKFAHILLQYRVGRAHAAKYSHHFVRRLNHCHSCDITGFDIEVFELDTPAYEGTPEDHFAFISHYKLESGTEATLMRNLMLSTMKSDPTHEAHDYMSAVFVDSEDLEDLTRLQAHVKGSTNIVVLLTPGLLLRPWCLLEFVTAVRNNVTIVPVEIQRPGLKYVYPDEDWYASLRHGDAIPKDSMALLRGMSITLEEVENAIRQIFLKIAVPFSPHKSGTVQSAEILDMLKRCKRKQNPGSFVRSDSIR